MATYIVRRIQVRPSSYAASSGDSETQERRKLLASILRRGKLTKILLRVNIVISGLIACLSCVQFALAIIIASGDDLSQRLLGLNEALFSFFGSLESPVYWLTAVAFIALLRAAYRTLDTLGVEGLEFGPGWSISVWLLPLLNIWMPFRLVKELLQESIASSHGIDGASWRTIRSPKILVVWWACFVVGGLLDKVTAGLFLAQDQDVQGYLLAVCLLIVTQALYIAAAFLLIKIIESLTAAQKAALSEP